jgi:Ca2+-binding EF-hand superfamily protein
MPTPSDVRAEKYNDTFNNFDVDGSGVVDQGDLAQLVQRVTSQFGYGPETSQYKAFEQACTEVWQALLSEAGKASGEHQELSKDEYVNLLLNASPAKIEAIFGPYVSGMFALVDVTGDGEISKEEFEKHQLAWGLSASEVANTFERLDADHDGVLSRSEYRAFMYEFFESGSKNSPANVLSGN